MEDLEEQREFPENFKNIITNICVRFKYDERMTENLKKI